MGVDIGYREVVLRPRSAQVLAVLVVAVCTVSAVAIGSTDAALLLRSAAPLALVALGAWALFWRPAVRVAPSGVVLVNPFRSVRVTWPAIEDVETRWGLVLLTAEGRFTAWAAPRSGALAAARETRNAMRRAAVGSRTTSRSEVHDVSGVAPALVLRTWTRYRDEGLLGVVEGHGVDVRHHPRTTAALVLLAALTVLGAALP